MRIAVVDASPLINLTHLDLARELALFFDRVNVPRAVQEEVNKKGRFRYRLNKLYRSGFFTRCMTADIFNPTFAVEADFTLNSGGSLR